MTKMRETQKRIRSKTFLQRVVFFIVPRILVSIFSLRPNREFLETKLELRHIFCVLFFF